MAQISGVAAYNRPNTLIVADISLATVIARITGPRPSEAVETSIIEVSVPDRGLAYVPDARHGPEDS
eukprot:gene15839-11336_t